jgi:arylsulfatase A-like enzyme
VDRAGIEEETIVIFTSDHGEMMGSHGSMGKAVFWDESFRVPFMIRWPNQLKARHEELLIGTPDIMPTVLGLMGLGESIPESVEGQNYVAAIQDQPDAVRPEFAWYYNAWNGRGLRTKDTACYFERGDRTGSNDYLFDMPNDPCQLENQARARPKQVKEFARETRHWMAGLNDKFIAYPSGQKLLDALPG